MRAITFDIDWAPDWMVARCLDLLGGTPATFHATHRSDILEDMRRGPNIELGIHPNFLPGSSHGDRPEAVLDFVCELVPEARVCRTHSLVQSTPLLSLIARRTNVEIDLSLFLPFAKNAPVTEFYGEAGARRLLRVPFIWMDDIATAWPGWDWQENTVPRGEVEIYNFHPIHIALNTADLAGYAALKQQLGGRPLSSLSERDAAPFINEEQPGAATFLRRLLDGGQAFDTVSGLARQLGY